MAATYYGNSKTSGSFTSSVTLAHDVGSSANRYLYVLTDNYITAVTYAGVSMSLKTTNAPGGSPPTIKIWVLANPASGTNNVVGTLSGTADIGIIAMSFYDCSSNQSSALVGSTYSGTYYLNWFQSLGGAVNPMVIGFVGGYFAANYTMSGGYQSNDHGAVISGTSSRNALMITINDGIGSTMQYWNGRNPGGNWYTSTMMEVIDYGGGGGGGTDFIPQMIII